MSDSANCYTIRDNVADFFLPPFFARNDEMAKRMFISSLGDSFPHRSDFQLFMIGAFNSDTGQLNGCNATLTLAGLSISPQMDPRPQPRPTGEPTK